MTVHVTIAMDEAVKASLDELARHTGRETGDILIQAAQEIAAEDAALEAAIAEARASLDAGLGIPHEQVVAEIMARRAERAARA